MKPKIICHIMGSVDGRILVDRWSKPYGGVPMGELMKAYSETGSSLNTDAWTFGKNTITEIFPEKFHDSDAASSRQSTSVFKAERTSRRLFIAIDPEADIKYPTNKRRGDDILAIVGMNATDEYLAFLRQQDISYIVSEEISNLRSILETVNREFGVVSISLQGGGVLNGSMLNQGLIDELSYLVYPGVDNSADSVSIFHSKNGLAFNISLELLSLEKKPHGMVWMRYRIHND